MKRSVKIILAAFAAGAIALGTAGCHTHVIVRNPGAPVTTTSP